MTSKTYYIFRHGETFASLGKTGYGDKILTADLLPQGIPAIEKLAEYLKTQTVDIFFSSEVVRCKKTSQIVSKIIKKEVKFDSRLNEWLYEESFEEVKKRVIDFVEEIESSNLDNIAICSHGAVLAGLKHVLIEGGFLENQYSDYPDPGVLMEVRSGVLREKSFR